ncbi:hypothetical protein CWI38_0294p0060 [Hamiltosporidium tvaerminnensis]|uniref:Uncharacterized protein n=1 Tax=Hamiltosporidium tvaerminnensis TaxID=1176355 RepID=A0A4Q9LZS4_9MICR|nr:hypothetical protein CWI38_0294p0060 [Hamiltosporidium tvaerminnensis]
MILINLKNSLFYTPFSDEINSVSFFTTNATHRQNDKTTDNIKNKEIVLKHLNALNINLLNIHFPVKIPMVLQQQNISDVEDGLIQFIESVFESTDIFSFAQNMKANKNILWFILEIRNKYFRFQIEQNLSILVEKLYQINFETQTDPKPTNINSVLKYLKKFVLKKLFLKNKNFKAINEQKMKNEALLNESLKIFGQILTEFEFLILNFHFEGSFERIFLYLNIETSEIRKSCLCETGTNWVTGFFNNKSIFNILNEGGKRIHGASIGSIGIHLSNDEYESRYFTFCFQLNMYFDFVRREERMKVFETHFWDLFILKKSVFQDFSEQEITIFIIFFYQEKVSNIKLTDIYLQNDSLYFEIELDKTIKCKRILKEFSDKIFSISNDYHKFNLIFIDISFFRNSCVFDVKENFDVSWGQQKNDLSSIFSLKALKFNINLIFLRLLKLQIYNCQSANLRFKIILVEENILDKPALADVLREVLNKHVKDTRKHSKTIILDELTPSRINKLLSSTKNNYTFYDEYLDVIDSLIEELSAMFNELIRHKTIEGVFCDRKNDGSFDSQKVLSQIKNLKRSENLNTFKTSCFFFQKTNQSISNKKKIRT